MKLKSILFLSSAMLMFTNSFGQLHVTTGTTKYVLLEEGTGTWCGYCPDGAQDISQSIDTNKKALSASWHNGDPMEVSGDPFNNAFITGFPMATIDRAVITGSAPGKSRPWHMTFRAELR